MIRRLAAASLVACLVAVPCTPAFAADTEGEHHASADGLALAPGGGLLLDRLALVEPAQSPHVLNQSVASTSQHNFILGATAAALVVGGVALIAYSTTPSCKNGQVSNSRCDRDKVLGAVGVSGGAIMLVLWALSK